MPLLLLLLPVADPIADEDKEDGGDSGRARDEEQAGTSCCKLASGWRGPKDFMRTKRSAKV